LPRFAPWLIGPLLIAGGLFLCFEGFEKIWHALTHSREEIDADEQRRCGRASRRRTIRCARARKIRGAIRTDFILSAEIIVITLGIVGDASLLCVPRARGDCPGDDRRCVRTGGGDRQDG
jgi:predicted DNA repair protein MutK